MCRYLFQADNHCYQKWPDLDKMFHYFAYVLQSVTHSQQETLSSGQANSTLTPHYTTYPLFWSAAPDRLLQDSTQGADKDFSGQLLWPTV